MEGLVELEYVDQTPVLKGTANYNSRNIIWMVDNHVMGITGLIRDNNGNPTAPSTQLQHLMSTSGMYDKEMIIMPTFMDEVKSCYIWSDQESTTYAVVVYLYTYPYVSTASKKGRRRTYFRGFDVPTKFKTDDYSVINSLLGTFITLLLINVVLGTLGTFWLQIRKRTEDIGIMRSFGAKRRHIFGMLWKEAALLTLIASIIGQLIWLQVAQNSGLAHGGTTSGTNLENDWPQIFWQHYLVICVLQFLILLLIVTIGMVVPTFLAMYKRPVEALHHE